MAAVRRGFIWFGLLLTASAIAAPLVCGQADQTYPPTLPAQKFDREIAGKYCKLEYRSDRENDARQLSKYIDHGLASMAKDFKSLDPMLLHDFKCSVLQYSEPEPGYAEDGHSHAETDSGWIIVTVLAQSSVTRASRTVAGEPKDDDYTAKTVTDELSTALFERITRDKGTGWRFHSAPQWFVQGIEGYAGMTHSTAHERKVTIEKYVRMVQIHGDELTLTPEVHVKNPYVGGLAFIAFLYRTYGPKRVGALLLSSEPTFDEAFRDRFGDAAAVGVKYSRWIAHVNTAAAGF